MTKSESRRLNHGLAVALTPAKKTAGLIRKRKALVFSTGGCEKIDAQIVNRVLDECRDERISRITGST